MLAQMPETSLFQNENSDSTEAFNLVISQLDNVAEQQARQFAQAILSELEGEQTPRAPPAATDRSLESEQSFRVAILRRQQIIKALRNELELIRELATKDAEYARELQRCTVVQAEERFDAATSVLKLRLREAEAKSSAAERQMESIVAEAQCTADELLAAKVRLTAAENQLELLAAEKQQVYTPDIMLFSLPCARRE